jgi:membrane peptidoglycan carboxypeptidase
MNWRSQDLNLVKLGMWDVVNSGWGTGRRAKLDGVSLAAKTGTAEYMDKGEKKKNAWMIGFAPFEKPKYAIVTMQEDSDAGGLSAARLMRQMTQAIFLPDTVQANIEELVEEEQSFVEINEVVPVDADIDLEIHPEQLIIEPILISEENNPQSTNSLMQISAPLTSEQIDSIYMAPEDIQDSSETLPQLGIDMHSNMPPNQETNEEED